MVAIVTLPILAPSNAEVPLLDFQLSDRPRSVWPRWLARVVPGLTLQKLANTLSSGRRCP